jgi:hypothetical protein
MGFAMGVTVGCVRYGEVGRDIIMVGYLEIEEREDGRG